MLRTRSRSAMGPVWPTRPNASWTRRAGLQRAVGPEQPARPGQRGGERDSLRIREAADEVDDAAAAAHPGELGVAGPPVEPLRMGRGDPLVAVGGRVDQ